MTIRQVLFENALCFILDTLPGRIYRVYKEREREESNQRYGTIVSPVKKEKQLWFVQSFEKSRPKTVPKCALRSWRIRVEAKQTKTVRLLFCQPKIVTITFPIKRFRYDVVDLSHSIHSVIPLSCDSLSSYGITIAIRVAITPNVLAILLAISSNRIAHQGKPLSLLWPTLSAIPSDPIHWVDSYESLHEKLSSQYEIKSTRRWANLNFHEFLWSSLSIFDGFWSDQMGFLHLNLLLLMMKGKVDEAWRTRQISYLAWD